MMLSKFRGKLTESNVSEFDFVSLIENQDFSESTIKSYRAGVLLFLDWVNANRLNFLELTVYDFIAYKRWISGEFKVNSTRNSYLTGVMAFYKLLERHGVTNICQGVRKFDRNVGFTKDGITREQWQKMLSLVDRRKFNGKKHYLLMYMLYTSGVRQMSLRELKWGDFTFSSKVNSLVMNVRLKGKGNRTDSVMLNEEAVFLLEQYKFSYAKLYCMSEMGEVMEIPEDYYVFGNKRKMLSDKGIRKITETYLKKAGFYKKGVVTGHSLRHGIAEYLIEQGLELKSVQQFLCHRDIKSTMVYAGKKEKEKVDKVLISKVNEINLGDFYG